ncbi:MAG: hypothetical protein AB7S70_02500 [Hyphomicrobium sp.]|uniref:hypothetical protein n=1 Tax=Hyphomicrobium sp. TaxID=82 RepID=UPI003D0C5AAE
MRDDGHARLANIAIMAHDVCPGVGDIDAHDVGLLVMASGVDINDPACAKDISRDLLGMKAAHAREPDAWCDTARDLLQNNPLTADLVERESAGQCNEVDKAAELISLFQQKCGYKVTIAGNVFSRLSAGKSRQCRASEVEARISALQGKATSGAAATALWCRLALREHQEQVAGVGMKPWVEAE